MSFIASYNATESHFAQMRQRVDRALRDLGVTDLSVEQAMILVRLGDREMTVGDLTDRGCYAGCNVSYNVGLLLKRGHLEARTTPGDRRSKLVRLTAPARGIVQALTDLLENDVQDAPQSNGAVRPDSKGFTRISFHERNDAAA